MKYPHQKHKKLYLVSREVLAYSLKEALIQRGTVYEIRLADEKYQPEVEKKEVGFKKGDNLSTK